MTIKHRATCCWRCDDDDCYAESDNCADEDTAETAALAHGWVDVDGRHYCRDHAPGVP